jgi:hypothetical protein
VERKRNILMYVIIWSGDKTRVPPYKTKWIRLWKTAEVHPEASISPDLLYYIMRSRKQWYSIPRF